MRAAGSECKDRHTRYRDQTSTNPTSTKEGKKKKKGVKVALTLHEERNAPTRFSKGFSFPDRPTWKIHG